MPHSFFCDFYCAYSRENGSASSAVMLPQHRAHLLLPVRQKCPLSGSPRLLARLVCRRSRCWLGWGSELPPMGASRCPRRWAPQQATVPSVPIPHESFRPAVTALDVPLGASVSPAWPKPQQATAPSVLSPTLRHLTGLHQTSSRPALHRASGYWRIGGWRYLAGVLLCLGPSFRVCCRNPLSAARPPLPVLRAERWRLVAAGGPVSVSLAAPAGFGAGRGSVFGGLRGERRLGAARL